MPHFPVSNQMLVILGAMKGESLASFNNKNFKPPVQSSPANADDSINADAATAVKSTRNQVSIILMLFKVRY